jgi:CheY-specific phosphatase CheX
MNCEIRNAINESVSRVFETSAFMDAVPVTDATEIRPRQDTTGVTIQWFGPCVGRLILLTDSRILEELTANMLGVSQDSGNLTPEKCLDAIKEILNMICGNFLTHYYGNSLTFDLSPPRILNPCAIETIQTEGDAVCALFNLNDTLCELLMVQ